MKLWQLPTLNAPKLLDDCRDIHRSTSDHRDWIQVKAMSVFFNFIFPLLQIQDMSETVGKDINERKLSGNVFMNDCSMSAIHTCSSIELHIVMRYLKMAFISIVTFV